MTLEMKMQILQSQTTENEADQTSHQLVTFQAMLTKEELQELHDRSDNDFIIEVLAKDVWRFIKI